MAPLPMGFPRQEYWSGLPFPSLRDLPSPGVRPASPALQADSLPSEPPKAYPASTGCGLEDDGHTDREALPRAMGAGITAKGRGGNGGP